jgi:hypothetical protein
VATAETDTGSRMVVIAWGRWLEGHDKPNVRVRPGPVSYELGQGVDEAVRVEVRVVDRDLDARRFVRDLAHGPGPVIAVTYARRAGIAEVTPGVLRRLHP